MSEAVLGVDAGTARIGVAICEGPGLPAVPLTTIEVSGWAQSVAAVARLARQRGACRIVVGNPIGIDGRTGPAARRIAAFIERLREFYDGEVIAHDERFTTAIAAKRLRELPTSGSKRRRHVDEMAAVEILSTYLAGERR